MHYKVKENVPKMNSQYNKEDWKVSAILSLVLKPDLKEYFFLPQLTIIVKQWRLSKIISIKYRTEMCI